MDAVTLRWLVVFELAVAILFGALVLRPDAWILWRELAAVGVATLVVIPLAAGAYFAWADRKERETHIRETQRT